MDRKRKILFVVGNRAHYARVRPILKHLPPDDAESRVILFESAALLEFGDVQDQIISELGREKVLTMFTNISGGNLLSMTKSTGMAIMDFASEFANNRPDIVVVIADRYEALAAATAARFMNIPVAHVQGGEKSGSIDDSIRHAITKLANIHLVTNEECKQRVEKMGELSDTIFVTGCPTIDICADLPQKDAQSIFAHHEGVHSPKFVLRDNYIIVAFHPVTTEYETNREQFRVLLSVINSLAIQTIWLFPNIDAGNDLLKREIIQFRAKDKKGVIHFFKHFAVEEFLLLLKNAMCIVGNSSPGIRESSFFGTPSVSVGTRQRTRMRAENVIESKLVDIELRTSILHQIRHGRYAPNSLYGAGNAGPRIAQVLLNCSLTYDKELAY